MKIRFRSSDLTDLAASTSTPKGMSDSLCRAYRKMVNFIISANDERDLRANPGYHFEKLKGDRDGQYSMKLNDQWRLVLEIEDGDPDKTVHIAEIVDYHKGK